MEQIYYTQCPVGYGLGASNGFQVKRLSAGYPASGDFRQLGLRAFPGGGRTLAPPTLRYRREGETSEVAWLTPRAHEYETERGLWGRPGGHFAHGLRLDRSELEPIRQWPAGLFESPLWCRADREPTRGRAPDEVDLSAEVLFRTPDFAGVAPLAEGIAPDLLARLLAAVAAAAREGRTLFLIDEPGRLGPMAGLLTFAFPGPLRTDLTFSTYHDRPEELPGYRIQGTTPLARPNRAALMALGVVADLASGTVEPPTEPAPWASDLARWLTRREAVDEADWSATEGRARLARIPEGESPWSDAWLGHLFGFPEADRERRPPTDPGGWRRLGGFAGWSGRSGLGDEWIRHRGPAWWLDQDGSSRGLPEARSALIAHAILRDAWKVEGHPSAWGRVLGEWLGGADAGDREGAILRVFRAAPASSRPSFARSMLQALGPEGAASILDRLRSEPSCDRAMLLPMEATARVSAILEGGDPGSLPPIIEEALPLPGATSGVLDAVEAGLADRPEALPGLAPRLAGAFSGLEGLCWALRRGRLASGWIGPALRPMMADLGLRDAWGSLRDRTPESLRPALARAWLDVASDPGLPDPAFRWGVEALLLPLAPRPHDPSWAEAYLRRTPSGLDLLRRLGSPEYRKLGVLAWIKQARELGEISEEQGRRIDSCLAYGRALSSTEPGAFRDIPVPSVPPDQRGLMLGQMLARLDRGSAEGLPFVLGACRDSWPGAFEPGAAGLRSMAEPLARSLAAFRVGPSGWLGRLEAVLGHLGLLGPGRQGFEPDGLAAEVAATSARLPDPPPDPWPLRQSLLRHDRAWPILAADIRRDLAEVAPEEAPAVLGDWDRRLSQDRPERFFELFLNSADGPRLLACVLDRAADLRTLPPLPWWDHARHPSGRDDLRDGFARTAPLDPFPEGRLFEVRRWIEAPPPGLSDPGEARWKCLVELTNFRNAGRGAAVRWPIVLGWKERLPMAGLSVDDRHRVLARIIEGLDEGESHQVAELASWLRKSGVKDPARVARWAEEFGDTSAVDDGLRIGRMRLAGEIRSELHRQLRDAR